MLGTKLFSFDDFGAFDGAKIINNEQFYEKSNHADFLRLSGAKITKSRKAEFQKNAQKNTILNLNI